MRSRVKADMDRAQTHSKQPEVSHVVLLGLVVCSGTRVTHTQTHPPTDTHLHLSPSHKVLDSTHPKIFSTYIFAASPLKRNMKLDPPIPLFLSFPSLQF